MNGVINLKKQKMIIEKKSLCIIAPIGPTRGSYYTKKVQNYESDDDLDCIYKIIV